MGLRSDEVKIATIISACAGIEVGVLDLGKEKHFVINGFHIDVYAESAESDTDMYAECGIWIGAIKGIANEIVAIFGNMESGKDQKLYGV